MKRIQTHNYHKDTTRRRTIHQRGFRDLTC